jgi:hypothetical protein
MRAGSNLPNFRKKSSPLILNSKYFAVLKSKCVIKQRDLVEMEQLRTELRKLANRFTEKRWKIEGMLRRGADSESGKHWVRLEPVEGMRLLLDE